MSRPFDRVENRVDARYASERAVIGWIDAAAACARGRCAEHVVLLDQHRGRTKNPATINQLDEPVFLFVNFQQTLCFLLTGESYPGDEDNALAIGLYGHDSVETSTLENGSFDLVRPERVPEVAQAYGAVDLNAFKAKVSATDFQELVEEHELYDIESWLGDDAEIHSGLVRELEQLRAFYAKVVLQKAGVAIYVS